MIFYSFEFLAFLLVIGLLSYFCKGNAKRIVLLLGSLFFYGWGSITHIPLFLAVILFTYAIGRLLEKKRSKLLLLVGIILTILPLLVCKYVPFLAGQFSSDIPSFIRNISLPLGISFYTFQSLGYVIDVYKKKLPAEQNIITYGLFIAFFPQVMSGPIGRAGQLIPQIKEDKPFDYETSVTGLRMMAYGMFLKVFAADTLGYVVDYAFGNIYLDQGATSGILLAISVLFFSVQIYCDFNGYTTMAQGAAKVLGINLIDNFNHPYLSTSITDFWRRWHISLSSWFRDYVYFPLGGSRCGKFRASINLLITFLCSGIWHGANWTFAIWGLLNGVYLVVEKRIGLTKNDTSKARRFFGWLYTYVLICISWVFFRASTLTDALFILKKIFVGVSTELINLASGNLSVSNIIPTNGSFIWKFGMGIIAIILIALISKYEAKKNEKIASSISKFNPIVRWVLYITCMAFTLGFGVFGQVSEFIYFRF